MFRVVLPGRSRRVRTLLIALTLLGLLGSVVPLAAAPTPDTVAPHAVLAPSPSSHALPTPRAVTPTHTVGPTHPSVGAAVAKPSVGSGTGTFWIANSSFSTVPFLNGSCYSYSFSGYFDSSCYDQAVSPTLLNLSNGDVAIVFSIFTNESATTCAGSASATKERVAFAISTNGGASFGPLQTLGNNTCSYLDSIEPSFVVAPDGTIFGVYVEENYSDNQGYYTARTWASSYYYYYYSFGQGNDALGFTESSDNGVTFSTPVTILSGGNISKPQLAISGDSLYVLYENDSNGTSGIPYGQYGYSTGNPISENLLYSSDSGASWTGPTSLPGLNSSANDTALGGSIAVNSSGMVAVAYFTNHSCVGVAPFYPCYASGDDLVYTTSTSNGTSWSPLVTVQPGVGESNYYPDGYYLNGFFQVIPQAALTFDSSGQTALITWAGTYNKSLLNGQGFDIYDDWDQGGVFAAVGPASGAGFTVTMVQVATSNYDDDSSYNPTIAESSGIIYVVYTTANESSCPASTCTSPLDGNYVEFMQTSTDGGLTWSSQVLLSFSNDCYYGYCDTYNAGAAFSGFSSSLGFTATGSPLVAYALPFGDQSVYSYLNGTYYYNYTYETQLNVASIWSGPTVTVNFTAQDLSAGQTWSFTVNGNEFSTNGSSFLVTNVPLNQSVTIVPGASPLSEWGAISTPVLSVPSEVAFSTNSTVVITYSLSYLLTLSIEPTNAEYAEIWFDYQSQYYDYYEYNDCPYSCGTIGSYQSPYSWYFPANMSLELNSSAEYPQEALDYWTGLGNGSYVGSGSKANITFNGPINETGWLGGFGTYNVSVVAPGLPAGSTYSFEFDGSAYSGAAGAGVTVSGVGTGAHEITDVRATSTLSGWEYFGTPSPADPVLVPTETSVSLVFALVDVAAPAGTVTFQAQGLTAGTVWDFDFNGTVASSSTPWINVTTHAGTFPVGAYPVTSLNASVGYTPSGVSPTLSVATGTTYLITYVPAYKVEVIAGTGGGVTGGTGSFWVAAGTSAQYVASPHAGYGFGGWSGQGVGNYTGLSIYANITANGPIIETASFYPLPGSRFNMTFIESGLDAGTWWTVFLGSSGYSSNTSILEVQNLLACGVPGGTYNLTVPYAYSANAITRFLPTSHLPKGVCTTGTTVFNEVFAPEYYLTLQSTAGGFAEAQVGSNIVAASTWVAAGTSVSLDAVGQTGYDFLGWNGTGPGNYTGANLAQTILMSGPITELATFALHVTPPAPTYSVTFHEQETLVPGTVWSIVFGGNGYSSTSATLTVSGLVSGSYPLTVNPALSPDGQTRYTTIGNAASVSVTHNITNEPVTFSTSFWVVVSGTAGGTTSPGSGWVTAGSSIFLNVSLQDGYVFLGWNGTGTGAYSGPTAGTTLTVTGPISEVATFAPVAKQVSTGTAGTALWSQQTTWIALGIVGLIVGLVVGLVVSRRGGRQPPSPMAYEGPTGDAGGDSAAEGGTP